MNQEIKEVKGEMIDLIKMNIESLKELHHTTPADDENIYLIVQHVPRAIEKIVQSMIILRQM